MGDRPEVAAGVADVDLAGRTILVTGSTAGIGREAALALGRLGARVLVHGRDKNRGTSVVQHLHTTGSDATFLRADFASLSAVEEMAHRVRSTVDELDVLLNNAGGVFRAGGVTEDGIPITMGVNHLAPFLLTHRLVGLVPDDGRVVTVASAAHRDAEGVLDDLRFASGSGGYGAYTRSKLANVLFTRELARRLADRGTSITATCCHPGEAPGSAITRNYSAPIRALTGIVRVVPGLEDVIFDSVEAAAGTPVYLAASPAAGAAVSGQYFRDCEPEPPAPQALNEDTARRLWTHSADLAGVDPALDLGV